MIIQPSTIKAAFSKHFEKYASTRSRVWGISYHVDCWKSGKDAFFQRNPQLFDKIYEELRGKWQVFRRTKGQHWSAQQTYDALVSLDASYARKKLSELEMEDADGLGETIQNMTGIKATSSGPSLVAISKFLHFWNPRLFVIVDRGAMWSWVFGHSWLWEQVLGIRKKVETRLSGKWADASDSACDPLSYLAILLWAGDLVRQNPTIPRSFAEYVSQHADADGLPLVEYEAAAVEWLLLGLAELPPGGVDVATNESTEAITEVLGDERDAGAAR